jgi:ribosomal protein S8
MSQDLTSDALNQIMNAKKAEKKEVLIKRSSKFLLRMLDLMKKDGHIDYEVLDNKEILVKIIRLNECKAVKPRFFVGVDQIEKYLRRYLPSRNFGKAIISTSKGLLDQHQAYKENMGGSLIAYYY